MNARAARAYAGSLIATLVDGAVLEMPLKDGNPELQPVIRRIKTLVVTLPMRGWPFLQQLLSQGLPACEVLRIQVDLVLRSTDGLLEDPPYCALQQQKLPRLFDLEVCNALVYFDPGLCARLRHLRLKLDRRAPRRNKSCLLRQLIAQCEHLEILEVESSIDITDAEGTLPLISLGDHLELRSVVFKDEPRIVSRFLSFFFFPAHVASVIAIGLVGRDSHLGLRALFPPDLEVLPRLLQATSLVVYDTMEDGAILTALATDGSRLDLKLLSTHSGDERALEQRRGGILFHSMIQCLDLLHGAPVRQLDLKGALLGVPKSSWVALLDNFPALQEIAIQDTPYGANRSFEYFFAALAVRTQQGRVICPHRLNQSAHRAAARLASLPAEHLLHKFVIRCSTRVPRFHHTPLHKLFRAFPDLRNVAPARPPTARASEDDDALTVSVAEDKEKARAQALEALEGTGVCVFVQGCVSGTTLGAAAVVATGTGGSVSCGVSLGPAALRQAHDGTLAAITLALCAIMRCPRATRASVLVPDRTAIHMVVSQPDHPLSRLFLERLSTIRRRARSSLRVQLVWAPLRAKDHACAARTRDRALLAAGGSESQEPELPRAVVDALRNLRTERPVLQKQHDAVLLERWKTIWLESPQGRRCARAVDDSPPNTKGHPIYRGLSRAQCSVLTQLRSGHVGLNAYLARIRAVDSPLCSRCLIPETPAHFLLTCRRYTAERHALRRAVDGPLSLRSTIGNVKARAAVLEYVQATGRFEAYRLGGAPA